MIESQELTGKACRQKYFKECSIEEKIERTREAIKSLEKRVEFLVGENEKLRNHIHNGNQLLIPFDNQIPRSEKAYRGQGDEVYF